MANELKMAMVNAILTLKERGWSQRRIARELGINRETVARYLNLWQNGSKPATNPHTGSEASNAVTDSCELPLDTRGDPPANRSGPASRCEPYRQLIEEKLKAKLSGKRIWQDLRYEHGFDGSYYSVRRFIARLGTDSPLPFRRMECAPGDEAQIDFGVGAPIVRPDGVRRRCWVFRIVLSNSRKAYSEVVYRQSTDSFIGCLENAFWHFGGAPRTLVPDNLKAAVSKADWYDPDIHPKLQSFCRHYATVILPARPYMPRHKGKIEKGIDYVKNNALKGRTFASLVDQNRFLLSWEASVADTRIHGTTRKQVGKLFLEQEQPHLVPLPAGRFVSFAEARRSVHRDGYVEVGKSYYSVPPEYTGREVWARWDNHLVHIYNTRMEQIIVHARVEPGRFQTHPDHIHPHKRSGVEKGAPWLLGRARAIGPHVARWARSMLNVRGVAGMRVLMGLIGMAKRYECERIDRACRIALRHNAFRLRSVKRLIERCDAEQQELAFLDEHPIIRSMSDYGKIARTKTNQWKGTVT